MQQWMRHAITATAAAAFLVLDPGPTPVTALAPCGDFDECKVLVEINATDGDIGFHFLMDADDLVRAKLVDPNGTKIFEEKVRGALRRQRLTETFAESAEPLCRRDPQADPDEEIVGIRRFIERWAAGTYVFTGRTADGEKLTGQALLSYALPAAPAAVAFDPATGVVSWAAGADLGRCASAARLDRLVNRGVLPLHPRDVPIAAWEVVLEPDVDTGSPIAQMTFTVRVPGGIAPRSVTVPAQHLAALPPDTPVKIEVGAIGIGDNATFTEVDGFCVNEVQGCD
jgi:hypothetical protein